MLAARRDPSCHGRLLDHYSSLLEWDRFAQVGQTAYRQESGPYIMRSVALLSSRLSRVTTWPAHRQPVRRCFYCQQRTCLIACYRPVGIRVPPCSGSARLGVGWMEINRIMYATCDSLASFFLVVFIIRHAMLTCTCAHLSEHLERVIALGLYEISLRCNAESLFLCHSSVSIQLHAVPLLAAGLVMCAGPCAHASVQARIPYIVVKLCASS